MKDIGNEVMENTCQCSCLPFYVHLFTSILAHAFLTMLRALAARELRCTKLINKYTPSVGTLHSVHGVVDHASGTHQMAQLISKRLVPRWGSLSGSHLVFAIV